MKKLIIIMFALGSLLSANAQIIISSNYIGFERTGREEARIRPIFISTTKLNAQLNNYDLNRARHLAKKSTITQKQKDEYLNFLADFVITNKQTYLALLNFINSHKEQYTNNGNKNNGEFESFAITVNGKEYSIYYKFRYKFFDDLRTYLKLKKGDKKVIEAFEYL